MAIALSPAFYALATLGVAFVPIILVVLNTIANQLEANRSPPGCRKLGLFVRSNLHDQFHKKYSTQEASKTWKIKALFIYPVKSCYPVELNRGEVIPTGFKYDRQFCFAQRIPPNDKSKEHWQFITQRQYPKMTRIKTEMWIPDPSSAKYKKDLPFVASEGCIVVSFPWTPSVSASLEGLKNLGKIVAAKLTSFDLSAEPTISFNIPFQPTAESIAKMKYPMEKVTIWKETPKGYNMTSEVPEHIQEKLMIFLGMKHPIGLFRVDSSKYREVYRNAPRKEEAGYQPVTGFADAVSDLPSNRSTAC
jgi:hypothetical protein